MQRHLTATLFVLLLCSAAPTLAATASFDVPAAEVETFLLLLSEDSEDIAEPCEAPPYTEETTGTFCNTRADRGSTKSCKTYASNNNLFTCPKAGQVVRNKSCKAYSTTCNNGNGLNCECDYECHSPSCAVDEVPIIE